jgi:hypothetical protein
LSTAPTLTVSQYIEQQIAICGRPQTHIASDCGFANANMITHLKSGRNKVPLAKVGLLAAALGADPALLLRMVIQEYEPEAWAVIATILDADCMLTRTERTVIRHVRGAAVCASIDLDDSNNLRCLTDTLQSIAGRDRAKAQASVVALNKLPNNGRHLVYTS